MLIHSFMILERKRVKVFSLFLMDMQGNMLLNGVERIFMM